MANTKVCIVTFGCQMNKADSARVAGLLTQDGYQMTSSAEEADVILMNTCSVRDHAEQRALNVLKNLAVGRSDGRRKVLGLCGCVAERRGADLLKEAPEISLVVGPRQIDRIPSLLGEVMSTRVSRVSVGSDGTDVPFVGRPHVGVAEMVKVVEGCTNDCAYCIVPKVRGPEKSRSIRGILEEIQDLVSRGAREVILLGQNVMAFGTDQGHPAGQDLLSLLGDLRDQEDLWRVRLVTCHPRDIGRGFVRSLREFPQFCPQFQIPFQAGSDRVLRRMGRGYTREEYLERIGWIRETFRNAGIFVDIIVGFPGESEEDFQETLSLLECVQPDRAYVFKYSPRPGTLASTWTDDVSPEEKQRRLCAVEDLEKRLSSDKHARMIGSLQEVLVEGPSKKNASHLTGRTQEGRICLFGGEEGLRGHRVNVRIDSVSAVCLYGEIYETLEGKR